MVYSWGAMVQQHGVYERKSSTTALRGSSLQHAVIHWNNITRALSLCRTVHNITDLKAEQQHCSNTHFLTREMAEDGLCFNWVYIENILYEQQKNLAKDS